MRSRPEDVRLEHRPVVVVRALRDRAAAERETGVVHQDVDAAELLDARGDERLAALVVGDVERRRDVPVPASSAAACSTSSTRRAPSASRAPSAASARAVVSPIPLEAPVTIAVLPSNAAMAREPMRMRRQPRRRGR